MTTPDFPFYDPNPRCVLTRFNQEIKESDINYHKEDGDIIQSSPILLAFAISTATNNHLKLLMDMGPKFGINFPREQIKKLHSELLSLHYFLTTFFINKYIKGDQFTLFVLRTNVALLDILPKVGIGNWLLGFNPFSRKTKTEEIEKSVSTAILAGEDFYLRNKSNEQDKKGLLDDIKFFSIKEDVYENNLTTQFIIKGHYRISSALSVREDPIFLPFLMVLFNANMQMVKTSLEVAQNVRPIWHLSEDKNVINDYKMKNQEQTL